MSSSSNHHSPENFSLTAEDRFVLSNLRVPVPHNEQKRIETLRQSKLLDNASQETGFHRFTSLATRLFDMPFAAVSFIDVDSIHFKSRVGFELHEIHRNDWFDAYTILPESSEVYVIPDCFTDNRFKDKHFVRGNPKIRFYAGAAIMIENVKIGVLSIMDTQPHKFFSLEDKENLLDLGAAAAQLAKEKLQTALNLSTERANIVVSMMHHLRTPMTSLNFATSLLCNDVQQIRSDNGAELLSHVAPATTNHATSIVGSTGAALMDKGVVPAPINTNVQNSNFPSNTFNERKEDIDPLAPTSVFHAFESSFIEINTALNQLNILVDSSLSLGQAIIKCSSNDLTFSNAQTIDSRNNKFSECNIIEYLTDMFHNHLPVHNNNLEVEWIVDTSELSRGTHVTFPDAVMLIVISTVSHMSAESNSLGFYFSFEQVDEEDFEYPELINKMIEGKLAIKVFAKDGKAHNANGDTMETFSTDSDGAELPSKQNFLSIDKILRAINGSSKEYISDISRFKKSTNNTAEYRTVHEFFVPCKILLNSQNNGKSSNQDRKRIRFYRGKGTGGVGGIGAEKTVVVTIESPRSGENDDDDKSSNGKGANKSGQHGDDNQQSKSNNSEDAKSASEVNGGSAESKKPEGKVLRALVVEDTVPVQKLLTRWLQNHGCVVTCANNGKVGLDCMTSNNFDIAFIDFLMPVMLGITTMKLFQEWLKSPLSADSTAIADVNKEILIVGMSATALESEQEEAFKYGMHFFCPKPVSLDLLAIILNAKKDCANNEEAVNKICELTGTNYDAAGADDRNFSEENQNRTPGMANLIRTRASMNGEVDNADNDDGADKDGNKTRWTLFRSHKQSARKIMPDGGMEPSQMNEA